MEDNSFGGSWSAEKLDRVENYVHAYLTAMTRFTLWDYVYIDAFAGSGYQLLKGDNQATEQVATRLFVED